jgi:hypothetical protein
LASSVAERWSRANISAPQVSKALGSSPALDRSGGDDRDGGAQ